MIITNEYVYSNPKLNEVTSFIQNIEREHKKMPI